MIALCHVSTSIMMMMTQMMSMMNKSSWWRLMSYPVFMPKPSTHRMLDPGSIVPHIRPNVFTDNHMSRIKYNYYISNVSKDYDDSQQNGTIEDSITPKEQQLGQYVT
jgi:hypothetical protein